jgi:hypothetical protein
MVKIGQQIRTNKRNAVYRTDLPVGCHRCCYFVHTCDLRKSMTSSLSKYSKFAKLQSSSTPPSTQKNHPGRLLPARKTLAKLDHSCFSTLPKPHFSICSCTRLALASLYTWEYSSALVHEEITFLHWANNRKLKTIHWLNGNKVWCQLGCAMDY